MNRLQHSELTTNILVSCDKLEKFALQYAKYYMTRKKNDSQVEISIEDAEIGEVM